MKIQDVTNSKNFEGKLVIVNNLSNKPARCVKKIKSSVQELIRDKDFNLNIMQDYSNQAIIFNAEYHFPLKPEQRIVMLNSNDISIATTSKSSVYIKAAKDAIDLFEKNLYRANQLKYEKEQKQHLKQNIKDCVIDIFIGYPLSLIELIAKEIHPKFGKKVEKFIDKAIDFV